MSRVASVAWLGWRFAVVQPLRKAFRRESGQERFARAYFGEGCLPTSSEDREVALAAAACTGCGLCEARCAASRGPEADGGAPGLVLLLRLHAKDVAALRGSARVAACAGCSGCDDACPSAVPISRILAYLRGPAQRGGRP